VKTCDHQSEVKKYVISDRPKGGRI